MASNTEEVLDPAATIEKLEEGASRRAVNRRNFLTALGVAGAATGAVLVGGQVSRPRSVGATGFSQTDVLNFALNLEYLEATFYSYITQGTDLPASVTAGSGAVTNAPSAPLTFTGPNAARITDLLNEIYFDELNHVLALRNLLGSSAVARPALNLGAYQAITANNALSLARLLEDVGVTAYAGAASQLSGSNLTYAAQILAVEGFHSGALRLLSIQNQGIAPYYPDLAVTRFTGTTTAGSSTITGAYITATAPTIGQAVSGPGTGPGAVITGITYGYPIPGAVVSVGSNQVTGITSALGLSKGAYVVGTGIPDGTTISVAPTGTTAPFTLTLSNAVIAASGTIPPTLTNQPITGTLTKGSAVVTAVTNGAGVAAGQVITGANIPAGTTITAVTGSTLTMSAAASAAATAQLLVVGTTSIATSAKATASIANQQLVSGSDPVDVQPADPGTAAASALGPGVNSAGEPYGFFATSGTANASEVNPVGVAFARTTSQVLSILYGTGGIAPNPGASLGGFFPTGFAGAIKTT
ncbi:MAG: ferritin-like domain-containing protein [Acidobacteriota bacterium]|nr:ferritin-like domain-containing protein [Acidobacteriota bacterium]